MKRYLRVRYEDILKRPLVEVDMHIRVSQIDNNTPKYGIWVTYLGAPI